MADLPALKVPGNLVKVPGPPIKGGIGIKVLLVDDQPARLLTYEAILSGLDLTCVRALSGLEALQKLMEQEFALILLDVSMPGMDGFETARLIREHPRFERTPIIFVTGVHVTELDRLKGYEIGAIDYISVPVAPEILRSKVAVLVELYQRRSQLQELNRALEEARERVQVEHIQELATSEARFRSVFFGAGVGMVMMDATGRMRMVNPTFCAIVGRDSSELIDASCLSFTHPDDVQASVRQLERLKQGQVDSAKFEQRYVLKDAAVRWVRVNITRMATLETQTAGSLVAVVEDVSERIEARRALESLSREREDLLQAERAARSDAESAMRTKDEFLATLSHELRTPLSNVISWSRVLHRKHSAYHEELARGLNIIIDNAMAQSRLISDLLDMSRIVAGKITLESRRVDIVDLVAKAVNAQRPDAESKGLTLELLRDIDVGFVLGDATRLQQVFWNLLSNAIKFTPPNSGRIVVRIRARVGRHEIDVADPGEGIDPQFLPHIFGRFRQADGSIARRHGGLGLGLAIVKQLVEMQGGEVFVASAGPGAGATFTVRLPVYEADVDSPLPVNTDDSFPVNSETLRGYRVLAIEDQPAMLAYLREALEEHGAEVIALSSAQSALELLTAQRANVHVIISDLGLPELDGYQFIRAVRTQLGLSAAELPAVALTAFAREEDRVRSIINGYQAHLTKPYQVSQVIAAVRSLLADVDAKVEAGAHDAVKDQLV